jgi:hypothetical protein
LNVPGVAQSQAPGNKELKIKEVKEQFVKKPEKVNWCRLKNSRRVEDKIHKKSS